MFNNKFLIYNKMLLIKVKLLSDKAIVPTRAHYADAGHGLYSIEEVTIEPWNQALINTDIELVMPRNGAVYGRIAPRSGLSLKHGLDIGAGVIDASYSGSIKVLIRNFTKNKYCVRRGERIAKIIMTKIWSCAMEVVDVNIDDNIREGKDDRGTQSFGSSGI